VTPSVEVVSTQLPVHDPALPVQVIAFGPRVSLQVPLPPQQSQLKLPVSPFPPLFMMALLP
jgi:hypothetical protein